MHLRDHIEPKIDRKSGFKNDYKLKAIFNEIQSLEKEILSLIKSINRKKQDDHYKNFADQILSVVEDLVRDDNLRFKSRLAKGDDMDVDPGTVDPDPDPSPNPSPNPNPNPNPSPTPVIPNNIIGGEKEEGPSDNENLFDDTGFRAKLSKGPGFDLEFVSGQPDTDIETKKLIRSTYNDGLISIYREHPDFIERAKDKAAQFKNRDVVTNRLITYIAGEITVHVKNELVNKRGGASQLYFNKDMFTDLVEFIYNFEKKLQPMLHKGLSNIQ